MHDVHKDDSSKLSGPVNLLEVHCVHTAQACMQCQTAYCHNYHKLLFIFWGCTN